jgi:hypothetical protein
MGQPDTANTVSFRVELIDSEGERGEVKHLSTPRKKNQSEIPSVVASERGRAQTAGSNTDRVVGLPQGSPGKLPNRGVAEGSWKGQPKRVRVP